MEIQSGKKTITGRHIMLAAAVISLVCSAYWMYRIIFKGEDQWLSFGCTFCIGAALLRFSKGRK